MCNLYTKFLNFLEICKQFSNELVNEKGNIVRRGPVPRFSDLEVVALSMAAEAEEIDSENWLFESKLNECRHLFPNLICGLFARIISKVSAMTALQYVNYINGKPIGRIKYALN